MKGVFIKGFEKPKECGHHIDRYSFITNCPMARHTGTCRLINQAGRQKLSFKEQYAICPLQEIEIYEWRGKHENQARSAGDHADEGIS